MQLAWAWAQRPRSGDARLEATLPDDGDYTVAVHDAEYAAPAPGFFRLKVGQWSFVDQVFPPVVGKGTHDGRIARPDAGAIAVDAAGRRRSGAHAVLDWPKDGIWSGPRPFVAVSPHAGDRRRRGDGKAQDLPAGPVGV